MPIRGDELRPGDQVVVPTRWCEPPRYSQYVDLVDELLALPPEQTGRVYLYHIRAAWDDDIQVALRPHLSRMRRLYDYKQYDYLPFNLLRLLDPAQRERLKQVSLVGNHNVKLPAIWPVDEALVELLGLYTAEGCLTQHRRYRSVVLSFGAQEPALIKYTAELVERALSYKVRPTYVHQSARIVKISCDFVALLFEAVFKAGVCSTRKTVPPPVSYTHLTLPTIYSV